jgi:hypothetical protein
MGLFDPPTVKELKLKKKAQFIGGLYGNVHLGHFSPADLNELVHAESRRAELQAAFVAASAEVGPEKAMKAAMRGADLGADSYARLGKTQYGHVVQAAKDGVRAMLKA